MMRFILALVALGALLISPVIGQISSETNVHKAVLTPGWDNFNRQDPK